MPKLNVSRRPLTANDVAAYRALRRRILDIGDGKYFSDSYERERGFTTDKQWRDWCTETHEHCTIGTFIDGELVGIMGIVRYGVPQDNTVEWEATYLAPRYRKLGLAKPAYDLVRRWSEAHGYERAVVFIRTDNTRSLEIRKKQGAVFTHTKRNELWADGSIADTNCFEIELYPIPLTLIPSLRDADFYQEPLRKTARR